MRWIVLSVVLSVAVTVLLNVGLRAFPGGVRRLTRWVDDPKRTERKVRLFVPWKGMIVASVILTVVLNILLWMA